MKIVFGCDPNATEFKLQLMEYVKVLDMKQQIQEAMILSMLIQQSKQQKLQQQKNTIEELLFVEQVLVFLLQQTK